MQRLHEMTELPPELDVAEFMAFPDERLAGMPERVRWCAHQAAMVSIEVRTEYLRRFVPEELTLVEVRPGTSLMSLMVHEMFAGNTDRPIRKTSFTDFLGLISVLPDLTLDMPVPRHSYFALRGLSDEEAFIDNDSRKLLLDLHHVPSLRMIRDGDYRIRLQDDDGEICRFQPTIREMPPVDRFTWQTLWFQIYSLHQGSLRQGAGVWAGYVYEFQKLGDWGSVNGRHPYFRDQSGLEEEVGEAYIQFYSPLNKTCFERIWGMRDLGRKRARP